MKFLQDGDVLVLPSLSEGLPKVVLEALHVGLPVVTTPAAGAGLIVSGQNGFLVPEREVDGLARVLAMLIENPEQIAYMSQYTGIPEGYNLERMASDIIEHSFTWAV